MDAQRVPAWKRLGLKLKPADPQAEALNAPTAPPRSGAAVQRNDFDSPKRKRQPFGDSQAAKPSLKKPRTDDRQFDTPLRRQKSVSFAEGADSGKPAAPESKKAKSGPKKKKGPKSTQPQAPAPPPDLTVALDYLRRWKTSRDTWKFNKNHQTHLISNVFDPSLVPAADVDTFYEYIRDLKGHIRTRLSESARKVCAEDMDEEKNHFPTGTTDLESKKRQYEEIMSNLLRPSQSGSKRKHFNEADFATSKDADPEVARRVAKRMRAEIVVEELGTESDASETTVSEEPPRKEASEEPEVDKRVKLNDGTTRPAKRVRASKRRGADLDDSSSESSDSDSDSDSDDDSGSGSGSDSDSSSDSSDDSDDEMADAGANGQATSSSSSSSSDEDDSDDNGR